MKRSHDSAATTRRLRLHRETLRALTEERLRHAAGAKPATQTVGGPTQSHQQDGATC